MKRFDQYCSNLESLCCAYQQDLTNDFVTGGIVNKFSLQFELGWKVFKELLQYEGRSAAASGSPRLILKTAFMIYDFLDEETWLSILKARNQINHIYDSIAFKKIADMVLKTYIPEFIKCRDGIEKYYGAELSRME